MALGCEEGAGHSDSKVFMLSRGCCSAWGGWGEAKSTGSTLGPIGDACLTSH